MERKDEFYEIIEDGLELLGWDYSGRFTNEDLAMLHPICEKALALIDANSLSSESIEKLSLEAYNILSFQMMSVHERADYISLTYFNSLHVKPLLNLIDEAMLCFYRGYFTASLSLLFIALESCLRSIYGWSPGDSNPSFAELKASVRNLPESYCAEKAAHILGLVYSRYDALNPTKFEFNRHGLLHGIRGPAPYDEMNCARIIQLFDLICCAEKVKRTGFGLCLDLYKNRCDIYEKCLKNKHENYLTRVDWMSG